MRGERRNVMGAPSGMRITRSWSIMRSKSVVKWWPEECFELFAANESSANKVHEEHPYPILLRYITYMFSYIVSYKAHLFHLTIASWELMWISYASRTHCDIRSESWLLHICDKPPLGMNERHHHRHLCVFCLFFAAYNAPRSHQDITLDGCRHPPPQPHPLFAHFCSSSFRVLSTHTNRPCPRNIQNPPHATRQRCQFLRRGGFHASLTLSTHNKPAEEALNPSSRTCFARSSQIARKVSR